MSELTISILKDLTIKIGSGATPTGGQEAYKKEGISLIRSQNILDYEFSKKGLAFIDDKQADKLKNVIVNENDVLINITGDSVARVCKVPNNILPARVNQHVAILRADPKKLDYQYLKYFLLNPQIKKYLLRIAGDGGTRNALTKDNLETLEISAPTLVEEQKLISKPLRIIDQKIHLLHQQNKTLENMAQTLFKHWFVDFEFPDENGNPYKSSGGAMEASELGEIPKGWRVGIFEELIQFKNGYSFSSSDLDNQCSDECLKVFKMGLIKKGGGFAPEKIKSYIKISKCTGLSDFVLKKGDLLMSMTDMKDNISLLGHTALMSVDDEYIVNQRVGLIRAKNEMSIEFPYLYLLTNSRIFLAEIRTRANSGVQVNLSTQGIKDSLLVISSKNVNLIFDSIMKPIFKKIMGNQKQIQTLTSLRDSLLPKLMSGEIEVK